MCCIVWKDLFIFVAYLLTIPVNIFYRSEFKMVIAYSLPGTEYVKCSSFPFSAPDATILSSKHWAPVVLQWRPGGLVFNLQGC